MKLDKPQNVAKVVIEKIVPFVVLKTTTTIIAIDNHMVVIQVQIKKNIVKNVLLARDLKLTSLHNN